MFPNQATPEWPPELELQESADEIPSLGVAFDIRDVAEVDLAAPRPALAKRSAATLIGKTYTVGARRVAIGPQPASLGGYWLCAPSSAPTPSTLCS
jgi:hypothetical protein